MKKTLFLSVTAISSPSAASVQTVMSFGKDAVSGAAGAEMVRTAFDADITGHAGPRGKYDNIVMNGGTAYASPFHGYSLTAGNSKKKVAGRLTRDGRGVAGAEIFYTAAGKDGSAVTDSEGRFELIAEGEAIMIIGVRRDPGGAVEPLPVAVAASSEKEVSITIR